MTNLTLLRDWERETIQPDEPQLYRLTNLEHLELRDVVLTDDISRLSKLTLLKIFWGDSLLEEQARLPNGMWALSSLRHLTVALEEVERDKPGTPEMMSSFPDDIHHTLPCLETLVVCETILTTGTVNFCVACIIGVVIEEAPLAVA